MGTKAEIRRDLRDTLDRRRKKKFQTRHKGFVRYKVYVNGVFDKTITIKDHEYHEFEKPFYMKFPEYKDSMAGSEFDHTTMIINLIMP